MLDIQGAVYTRLTGDTDLVELLATYDALVDGAAVFTDFVPSDVVIGEEPVIVISSPDDNAPLDTFDTDYRSAQLTVRLYSRPDGSSLALMTAAEAARSALKTWPRGAIPGGNLIDATVTGPVGAPTDDPALSGLLLSVRLIIQET